MEPEKKPDSAGESRSVLSRAAPRGCQPAAKGSPCSHGPAAATILLDNPRNASLEPIEVKALADPGALFLCLPEHVAAQLELTATSQKEITTADGRRQLCPYVGPVHVRFGNRECHVGAVVLGDEVLLGAVPMEDLDLVVIPSERCVVANPLHPNFAAGVAKRVCAA